MTHGDEWRSYEALAGGHRHCCLLCLGGFLDDWQAHGLRPDTGGSEAVCTGIRGISSRPCREPPVRPHAAFVQETQGPAPKPRARAIKGQVRLDSIDRAFKGATLTISLYRIMGPDQDVPAERVAELRFFNVYKEAPRAQAYVPFTFGDFYPRPNVHYTLQCYLDMNANGVRDAGDYWNERRVDVLTPEDPEVVRIEDFALIGEGDKLASGFAPRNGIGSCWNHSPRGDVGSRVNTSPNPIASSCGLI